MRVVRRPPGATLVPYTTLFRSQGLRLGQVALRFGANDMGSIMIEENVVSAAGAHNTFSSIIIEPISFEIGRAHVNSSHSSTSYAVFCLKKKRIMTGGVQHDDST